MGHRRPSCTTTPDIIIRNMTYALPLPRYIHIQSLNHRSVVHSWAITNVFRKYAAQSVMFMCALYVYRIGPYKRPGAYWSQLSYTPSAYMTPALIECSALIYILIEYSALILFQDPHTPGAYSRPALIWDCALTRANIRVPVHWESVLKGVSV